jgi:hypothetical protein
MKTLTPINIRSGFAGLLLLAGGLVALTPLVNEGQGQVPRTQPQRDQRRLYYLSQETRTGSNALAACAAGYHMASLWEIRDTSNLKYNTELGVASDDSGFGPPTSADGEGDAPGWIRTGWDATSSGPGVGNCNAWTSDSSDALGTIVTLSANWSSINTANPISPWLALSAECSSPQHVWCVQD